MIEIVSKDADGFILIVDSSLPESWPYAVSILNEVVKIGDKPCVVAANKQDLEDAYPPEEVKKRMGVDYPVIGTIAIRGWNVEKVLNTLMEGLEG
jgi:hypothetical protein